MSIRFYRPEGEWGYLSNFAPHPISLHGKTWATNEHYFQAQKFAGTEHEDRVRRAVTPKEAAGIGRDPELPLRGDWETVKDGIMREACRAKFVQHPTLGARLQSTGDEELIEASPTDNYWGAGADGLGKNTLGRILMDLRAALLKERA